MDKSTASVKNAEDKTTQHKSLTPAVLGIPSGSHGAKLSSSMNLREKEELLLKLEAWRQARKEKLTATVLAKGKQSSTSKLPPTLPKPRIRTMSNPTTGTDNKENTSDGKKNVFDRLYENSCKANMKKPEEKNEKLSAMKPVVKPSKNQPLFGKHKVPKVILLSDTDNNSGSADVAYKGMVSSVPVEEAVSLKEDKDQVETDETQGFSIEEPQETNLLEHEEEVSKVKEIVSAELHNSDNSDNSEVEMPQETNLSFEEGSKVRDELCTASKNTGFTLEEALENDVSNHVKENIVEKRDEIQAESDELKKNNAGIKSDVKKNVRFETPREKILSAVHLRNELEDWLTEKGHSIDTYRHLRCFGMTGEKTPISHHRQTKADVSNSSFYSTAPNTPISEVINESDKENVTPVLSAPKIDIKDVEGWLGDLHRLIVHVEYPSDRCEEWLNAITKKFPSCTQLPIYWECLAVMNGGGSLMKPVEEMEESRNRKAEDHDSSIADMLDKLVIGEKCQSASKTERGLSTDNIFKSKTVKFALQEKAVKGVDPESGAEARRKILVATPVRRSARLQTPDKTRVIESLQSLDPETRRSVSFQPNDALLPS